jgi:hypothetical protein
MRTIRDRYIYVCVLTLSGVACQLTGKLAVAKYNERRAGGGEGSASDTRPKMYTHTSRQQTAAVGGRVRMCVHPSARARCVHGPTHTTYVSASAHTVRIYST